MIVKTEPVASLDHWRLFALMLASLAASACSSVGQAADEAEPSEEIASTADELKCPGPDKQQSTLLGSLGPAPGESGATAINTRGTVVGYSQQGASPDVARVHAFRWTAQTGMVDLDPNGLYSTANDVNEREEVAGFAVLAQSPGEPMHAVVWDAQNRMHDLGTLGGQSSEAVALNNRGQVIGLSETSPSYYRPFIWDAQTGMVPIDVPAYDVSVSDINDSGTVVGAFDRTYYQSYTPFKWTKEEGVIVLDTLGSNFGQASSINRRGDIVGFVYDEGILLDESGLHEFPPDPRGRPRAVKWTKHGAWRLPNAANRTKARPKAINDWGLVVGQDDGQINEQDGTETQPPVALRWVTAGRFTRPPSVASDRKFNDVNDRGDIVGTSTSGGVSQATLWKSRLFW